MSHFTHDMALALKDHIDRLVGTPLADMNHSIIVRDAVEPMVNNGDDIAEVRFTPHSLRYGEGVRVRLRGSRIGGVVDAESPPFMCKLSCKDLHEDMERARSAKRADAPVYPTTREKGIAKREQFAAMAMQGLLSGDNYGEEGASYLQICGDAVLFADNLIQALEAKQ